MTIESKPNHFSPMNDFLINRNFMPAEKCDLLVKSLSGYELTQGRDYRGIDDLDIRKDKAAPIPRDEVHGSLYDDVQEFVISSNERFYRFAINGFEPMEYTVYDEIGSHFAMHIDSAVVNDPSLHRKFTFILQLSDEKDYEGGDVELFRLANINQTIPKNKGCITLFSSYVPYRVTPITSGQRHSIVGWVYGPPFC